MDCELKCALLHANSGSTVVIQHLMRLKMHFVACSEDSGCAKFGQPYQVTPYGAKTDLAGPVRNDRGLFADNYDLGIVEIIG